MSSAANVIAFPSSPTTFRAFWQLGYRRLVPIVPVDAPLSEHSTLALRIKKDPRNDGRGKTPGVRSPRDNLWRSFDWASWEASENDLERWTRMGAGVGIKCGGEPGLIAIDADTLDLDHARIVRDIVEKHLGRLPVRVGRFPKALYVCRVSEPLRYARVEFGERDAKGRSRARVEVLTDGRQFVAAGIHPQTREPYAWTREVPHLDALPAFSPDTILAVLRELQEALPAAKPLVMAGGRSDVDQEALRGDPAAVRRAVEATPNTTALFPTREEWLGFGYAIKAALPDDPDLALELFQDWSERWEDPDGEQNDPDYVAAEWRRCKPPFRRGASWLFEVAESASGGKFDRAELWFDVIPDIEDPFEIAAQRERAEAGSGLAAKRPYFDLLTVRDLAERPDPKWLIARHLPEEGLGFLYGDPGTGKSFLALDMAMAIAYGLPDWHGDAITQTDGVVVYIAGEGVHGFKARTKAWLAVHAETGLKEGEEPRFRLVPQPVNMMQPDDVTKLIRSVRDVVRERAIMIVVDTVSRAIPGAEENLQKDMSLFVEACGRLREEFGCVVLGIHHAGKSGDMRGSTVLRGAGDFVFKLESKRESAGSGPSTRKGHLICEKVKDGEDGWSDPYVLNVVRAEGVSSLVPLRVNKSSVGDNSAENLPKAFLTAMKAAWDAGRPWSKSHVSGGRWVVRIAANDFGLSKDATERMIFEFERDGIIAYRDRRGKHSGGAKQPGYEVLEIPRGEAENSDLSNENGIFE